MLLLRSAVKSKFGSLITVVLVLMMEASFTQQTPERWGLCEQ